ncbi:hypothetical protein DSO57_1031991 [Entomophthora muscae]|uniref:Uncharacterized protein n=1 Tax=Entomophthora muscae TaxID=34485 RepID=A0ACC2S2D5_9FUNG|nr:hypothetical protein DSO57_1031991 [Entomophthora muscae]
MQPLFFGLICLALVALAVSAVLFGVALSIRNKGLEMYLVVSLSILGFVQALVSLGGWSLMDPYSKSTLHVCSLVGPVTSITQFASMLVVGLIAVVRFTRIARKCLCDKVWIPIVMYFVGYIALVVVVRDGFAMYPVSMGCPLYSDHSSLSSAAVFMLGLSYLMQIGMTLFSTISLNGLEEVHMWPSADPPKHRKSCYASTLTPHERQILKRDPHDSLRSITCTILYTALVFTASIIAITQSSKAFPNSTLIDSLATVATALPPVANPMFILLTHATLYHRLSSILHLSTKPSQ